MLQGPEGTTVSLRLSGAGGGAPRDLQLIRAPITLEPVQHALCASSGGMAPSAPGDRLGYIRLATFSKQTGPALRAAIGDLQAKASQHIWQNFDYLSFIPL
jgi:C-terminal processing protease CtpA/Prc